MASYPVIGVSELRKHTLTYLYRSGKLSAPPAHLSPRATPNPLFNSKIVHVQHDISRLEVDAVVNAANRSLLGGSGVDGAIHRAAGPNLLRECETLGGCDTGSANITKGYNLPAKKIIHAVGPQWFAYDNKDDAKRLLQGCYRTSLELAVSNGLKSIAFPTISTGIYGYPPATAAEQALEEVRRFFDDDKAQDLELVVFLSFLQKDIDAYEKWLPVYFPPPGEDTAKGAQPTGSAEATAAPSQTEDDAPTSKDPPAQDTAGQSKEDDVTSP